MTGRSRRYLLLACDIAVSLTFKPALNPGVLQSAYAARGTRRHILSRPELDNLRKVAER